MIEMLKTLILDAQAAELGVRRGTVVTRDEEELVEVEGGTVEIVPAWRFLLMLDKMG